MESVSCSRDRISFSRSPLVGSRSKLNRWCQVAAQNSFFFGASDNTIEKIYRIDSQLHSQFHKPNETYVDTFSHSNQYWHIFYCSKNISERELIFFCIAQLCAKFDLYCLTKWETRNSSFLISASRNPRNPSSSSPFCERFEDKYWKRLAYKHRIPLWSKMNYRNLPGKMYEHPYASLRSSNNHHIVHHLFWMIYKGNTYPLL